MWDATLAWLTETGTAGDLAEERWQDPVYRVEHRSLVRRAACTGPPHTWASTPPRCSPACWAWEMPNRRRSARPASWNDHSPRRRHVSASRRATPDWLKTSRDASAIAPVIPASLPSWLDVMMSLRVASGNACS